MKIKYLYQSRHLGLLTVLFVGIIIGFSLVTPSYAEDGFIAGFEDVPLMSGLSVLDGEGMDFDSPSGRIVEVIVQGSVTLTRIKTFYHETLPALGWQEVEVNDDMVLSRFVRDQESLSLEYLEIDKNQNAEKKMTIRFTLAPQQN
jgi:hypothetical protein